jgi:hypothetical protein
VSDPHAPPAGALAPGPAVPNAARIYDWLLSGTNYYDAARVPGSWPPAPPPSRENLR